MIAVLKEILSHYFLIPLVFVFGLYLTKSFGLIQIRLFKQGLLSLFKSKDKNFSPIFALAAVLGGNLGTGNIAGISVALIAGGPGALFWMWVMAFFGAIIKFFGVYLGVIYRQKSADGYAGGPMYYLSEVSPTLAFLFCVATVCGAMTTGNLVQINSIIIPLHELGFLPLFVGIFMAVFVGCVIVSGAKIFAQVAAKIVPLMALLYVISCAYILVINSAKLPQILLTILNEAFSLKSMFGGGAAFAMLDAMRVGFDRGLFATDAGIGLAPILHSKVSTESDIQKDAITQATISMIAPFIVMVICLMTGLVLLSVDYGDVYFQSNICTRAFQAGFRSNYAGHLVTITLCLFAFTTILTWGYCAESCLRYYKKKYLINIFRFIYIIIIPLGGLCSVSSVWLLADISLNVMLIINLLGLFKLKKLHCHKVQLAVKSQYS